MDWVMIVELQVPNDYLSVSTEPNPVDTYLVREYLKRRLNELIEEGYISYFHVLSPPRQVMGESSNEKG